MAGENQEKFAFLVETCLLFSSSDNYLYFLATPYGSSPQTSIPDQCQTQQQSILRTNGEIFCLFAKDSTLVIIIALYMMSYF